MFGFSKKRMKIGRLKVQLSDPSQGTKSPLRPTKRVSRSNGEATVPANHVDEPDCECSPSASDINNCTSGSSESWMVLSIGGEKPKPRFNHAAAVVGNKMVVVGGESGNEMLDDVQVLDFDHFSWTTASSKLYLSPSSLPLKIPACKGHSLVSWSKKALLVGGKTEPGNEKISVWSFDTETECWSLMEAKGDIPVARSDHTVVRASTSLILFGGEDSKRRKLNDLHLFDLKSMTWLPLRGPGAPPSPRSNHVAALYDDRILYIFGGSSKSKTLSDLHSFDFETMMWSRIKTRGHHPSPRAGCCGVLCGTKWYITGGGSRKKRHAETLVFDVLKVEWSVVTVSPPSSITTNKGFSLVLVHKEKDFLVAFGGSRKEPSNQVEVLILEKNGNSSVRRVTPNKGPGQLLHHNHSAPTNLGSQLNGAAPSSVDSVLRQNLASAIEEHGSSRRSVSESVITEANPTSGNVSLRKKFDDEEELAHKRSVEDESYFFQSMEQRKPPESVSEKLPYSNDATRYPETDIKSTILSAPSSIYQMYETKMADLIRKNGMLEAQLAAALASRESAEKNLSAVMKSKQETEKKLAEATKEVEMLKEKLAGLELAQEEANSLSNIVHSDNVRLEHDVAFLKAVLDDTQKELHSTRGVLATERARAFQLQVEVFHLKQRLQSLENRAPTPRKPFQV